MKKLFFSTILVFLVTGLTIFAQQGKDDKQQIILKPSIQIQDLIFAANALNSIDISGAEAEAFIVCRKALVDPLQKAQKENKTMTDIMQIDIPLNVAQGVLNLLQRAKFQGAQVENYKRFVDSVVESAKPYQKEAEKK